MKCAAGIVLYNPDISRLKENIDSIYFQVGTLILVDNGSKNKPEIDCLLAEYNRVNLIRNSDNCGISKALNQIVHKTITLGYKWLLTLDQDSVCFDGLIRVYEEALEHSPDVAIISCKHIERNLQLSENDLTMRTDDILGSDRIETRDVNLCITSGSFTNVDFIIAVGGYDENMFIDAVDFDICYTLREAGYKIIEVNCYGILHEVGHCKSHRFLGRTYISYNHPKIRCYYYVRNNIYITRKHHLDHNVLVDRLKTKFLVVVLFEKGKLGKISAMLKGIIDGKKMPIPTH